MLEFYVPPTAKVIQRRDLGLKSHPKDWRNPGSNSGPLVYKAGSLTARPRRLQYCLVPPPEASQIRLNEPPDEKTCLQGFQPGQTQTELYNRRWLKA